jgi:hypothetical protein
VTCKLKLRHRFRQLWPSWDLLSNNSNDLSYAGQEQIFQQCLVTTPEVKIITSSISLVCVADAASDLSTSYLRTASDTTHRQVQARPWTSTLPCWRPTLAVGVPQQPVLGGEVAGRLEGDGVWATGSGKGAADCQRGATEARGGELRKRHTWPCHLWHTEWEHKRCPAGRERDRGVKNLSYKEPHHYEVRR